jgi:hypothetical protein
LDTATDLDAFLDEDRLKGGQFYKEALATALCESVCMVSLYWPTYFSLKYPFCSREYKLMEKLETQRLLKLSAAEQQNGLVIVIALKDFDKLPAEIRTSRLCYDFEKVAMSRNMTSHPQFRADMREIRRYIAERCRVLAAFPPPDPTLDCPNCRLPDLLQIEPWLQQVLHPGIPFPGRQPGN